MQHVPYDLPAERAVIGSILLDPRSADNVTEILQSADMFYLERHAAIWRGVLDCVARRVPADLVSVGSYLRSAGEVANLADLDACMAEAAEPGRVTYYAAIVADHADRRRIIEAGGRVAAIGYDTSRPLAEVMDAAAAEVYALQSSTDTGAGYQSISAVARARAADYMAAMEHDTSDLAGIPTGWADLDRLIGGLKPGDFCVIGGRPSMGKTALLTGLIENVCGNNGYRGAMVSMEMSKDQIIDRIASSRSGVNLSSIVNGRLRADDANALFHAIGEIEEWPIDIDDTPGQSITTIRARARRLHSRTPIDILFIDYLQMIAQTKQDENASLTDISRGLKSLARELKIPIVALAQLSREVERRADKRPTLSDLRGSGSIEQDADHVWFLYRDEYYNRDSDRKGIVEVSIAKHRNGPTGLVELRFDAHCARFTNLSRYQEVPGYGYAA